MSTIAAVATAPGKGAIGIVRISGPSARSLLEQLVSLRLQATVVFRPWVLHRGRFLSEDGSFLDDVLAVYMPAPKTYTGEDMAEIHCHGSPIILQTVLKRLYQLGALPAQPGEFTKRAFLHGRMDLSQAEAVAELVNSSSEEALKNSVERLDGALHSTVLRLREKTDHLRAELACAVDFPDDELDCLDRETFAQALEELDAELSLLLKGKERARLMQEGALVVLVGAVNAGKSSLMNALLGRERALVTDIPGTTRDFLEEMCSLDGLPVRLTDTAGLRSPAWEGLDRVERLGIARGKERCELADCLLLVFDASQITDQDLACDRCPDARYGEWLSAGQASPVIVVINKIDVKRSSFLPPV